MELDVSNDIHYHTHICITCRIVGSSRAPSPLHLLPSKPSSLAVTFLYYNWKQLECSRDAAKETLTHERLPVRLYEIEEIQGMKRVLCDPFSQSSHLESCPFHMLEGPSFGSFDFTVYTHSSATATAMRLSLSKANPRHSNTLAGRSKPSTVPRPQSIERTLGKATLCNPETTAEIQSSLFRLCRPHEKNAFPPPI